MKLVPLVTNAHWTPQRLVPYQPQHFHLWTFRQRTVFALVDGRRTGAHIAQMLSTSKETVIQTLHELHIMGMVTKETQTYDQSEQ